MFKFGPTFIWTIVNLLILYFILKKLLFNKVTDLMEKRSKSISDSIDNAKNYVLEAEINSKESEKALANARIEAANVIEESRKNGEKEYDDIIKKAKLEASVLIRKTTDAMEQDRTKMIKEMYDQIVNLSLEAASRVVECNMDTEKSRQIVESILEEEGLSK